MDMNEPIRKRSKYTMIGLMMLLTVSQLPKPSSSRKEFRSHLTSRENAGIPRLHTHKCRPQLTRRATTNVRTTGTRFRENGKTVSGPRYVITPKPTRRAFTATKFCCASSIPLNPQVSVTEGTATANQERVRSVSLCIGNGIFSAECDNHGAKAKRTPPKKIPKSNIDHIAVQIKPVAPSESPSAIFSANSLV